MGNYRLSMAAQQQHSRIAQLGQSLDEGLALHSEGKQPQSAHLISMLIVMHSFIIID
jgi:hypothetical protein